MRPSRARPSGIERTFGAEEVIVSKTDTRGVITYANEVFLRVSAYDEDDVVGAPHNLIRHPDMPRAIFKLAWDAIGRGEEIFAYVVNLASDGAHYWVLAHMTPSFDASRRIVGYHSNRRSPDRAALSALSPVYRQLRSIEQQAATSPAGLELSSRRLVELLEERGETYDQFVWSLHPTATTGAAR